MKIPDTDGSKKYRVIGGLFTLVYLAAVGFYSLHQGRNLLDLDPNELGDFLAGVFGPIGILWLILGFWQQGDELRSSVRALELQSEELRKSVEQQKELVNVTRLQVQSEIDAQHEERQTRFESEQPKLYLSNDGGTKTGRTCTSRLKMINLGADCADVKIFSHLDEFPKLLGFVAALRTGEEYKFSIQHESGRSHQFDVEVRYVARSGEADGQLFSLISLNAEAIGFAIEKTSA